MTGVGQESQGAEDAVGGRDLVIVGAGGHGREVLDVLRHARGPARVCAGFVSDDEPDLRLLDRLGVPWLGPLSEVGHLDVDFVIGVGDPATRRRLHERASSWGWSATSLWHRTSHRALDVSWGPGTVVLANASVTSNVRLGLHVHVNLHASVAHDCVLEDYVTINPGASVNGNVSVGAGATIGSGAVLRQGVTIGARARVGAGAVVIGDVAEEATVVGVPARTRT